MTAVILLAHGSPDARSSAATHQLAAEVEGHLPGSVVRAAFLQHDAPDVTSAVRAICAHGHQQVIVVPALLTSATHMIRDVPEAIAAAEAATGVDLIVSDPIGPDPALLPALDRALPAGPAVLATAGTTDQGAQQVLERLAATWSEQRKAAVMVAYAAQAAPGPAEAVRLLEMSSGVRVAVAAFVLFPGLLPDRIAAAAGDRPLSPPLYCAPETVQIVESRIAGARQRAA